MAFKETKRKGFNFFRSYYDVFNELESDKDKLDFINALLDRQFLGVKPEGLTGMVKFAWISQVNSIDSQVKGYEDKTKIKLSNNTLVDPPCVGGVQRGNLPPTEQEKEKEKEKEKEQVVNYDKFLEWFNSTRTKYLEIPSNVNRLTQIDKSNLHKLKEVYSNDDFNIALLNICNDKWANESNQILPNHFLKEDNFVKYLNMERKPILTRKQKKLRGWEI